MPTRTLVFIPLLLLLASVAQAQPSASANPALFNGPIVGGRHHQPTQEEIKLREQGVNRHYAIPEQDRPSQPETDRLYEEIMRWQEPKW